MTEYAGGQRRSDGEQLGELRETRNLVASRPLGQRASSVSSWSFGGVEAA